MKTILTLAIAAAALTTASTAEAGNRYQTSYYNPRVQHCAPVYVCTKVVCQHTECRYAYDHCGRRYSYHVNVVTYADIYSDGSRRTYTRTSR